MPQQFDIEQREQIQKDLARAFSLAFPDKSPATIKVFPGRLASHEQDGCFVSFDTPADNVRASKIVTVAMVRRWTAAGYALGIPWYVGFETTELLQPIKFVNVPDSCKDDFIADLPDYITHTLDPSRTIELVDIWELESRASPQTTFEFDHQIIALLCIQPLPTNPRTLSEDAIHNVAINWPGWLHFDQEHLITLDYPSRFNLCNFCKHTMQDGDQRHSDAECRRSVCGVCGYTGHDCDANNPDPNGLNRRACQEAKKRGMEERGMKQAKGTQNTTQSSASQMTSKDTTQRITMSNTTPEKAVPCEGVAHMTTRRGKSEKGK